jgi:hypothetical protein
VHARLFPIIGLDRNGRRNNVILSDSEEPDRRAIYFWLGPQATPSVPKAAESKRQVLMFCHEKIMP